MCSKVVLLICIISIGLGVQCAKYHFKPERFRRGVASGVGGDIITTIAGNAASEAVEHETEDGGCAHQSGFGCIRGYCWAGCDATVAGKEWCYTTKGFSQDFKYVPCKEDKECNRCWKCAGACTI